MQVGEWDLVEGWVVEGVVGRGERRAQQRAYSLLIQIIRLQ